MHDNTTTPVANIPWEELLRFAQRIQAVEAAKQQVTADFLHLLSHQTPPIDVPAALALAGTPPRVASVPVAAVPAPPAAASTASQPQLPKKFLNAVIKLVKPWVTAVGTHSMFANQKREQKIEKIKALYFAVNPANSPSVSSLFAANSFPQQKWETVAKSALQKMKIDDLTTVERKIADDGFPTFAACKWLVETLHSKWTGLTTDADRTKVLQDVLTAPEFTAKLTGDRQKSLADVLSEKPEILAPFSGEFVKESPTPTPEPVQSAEGQKWILDKKVKSEFENRVDVILVKRGTSRNDPGYNTTKADIMVAVTTDPAFQTYLTSTLRHRDKELKFTEWVNKEIKRVRRIPSDRTVGEALGETVDAE